MILNPLKVHWLADLNLTLSLQFSKSIKALLREYLSDDWHIFQSIPLDTKRADGEIDFFLLHKSVGAIVLEVKGGIIEAELNKDNVGQWYSTNTQGDGYNTYI